MTADIAAFILARLAEEERDARAACQEPWSMPWPGEPFLAIGEFAGAILTPEGLGVVDPPEVQHMVRQQPAATLARVVALRGLMGLHRTTSGPGVPESGYNATVCDACGPHEPGDDGWKLEGIDVWDPVMYPCPTIRHVAAIWRDHEDYDEERWKP
ncbi:DUF6221 family protein [Parafrankia soli]|uniref:DUF6221 family protein n=1 Tax=Parafrankia soli TaxID=2599596 RepID=UPI001041DA7C|nr:DUF6221 family protein [Parafrankia soli]